MRWFLSFTVLAATAFLLGACNSRQPRIVLGAANLDLGSVVNGEIVSQDLTLRNDGDTDLVIDSISTSCSCTVATLMPMTIKPGQRGNLHIEFDSGFHGPTLKGPLIRQVFIRSNDPQIPELKVELIVNVEARND